MGRRRRRIALLAAAVASLLSAAVAVSVLDALRPNRLVIRNSSGAEILDVRLVLRDLQGSVRLEERIPRLPPGDERTFRHGLNDFRTELRFLAEGAEREHVEEYVDLWRGEGWLLDVRALGCVRSGYDGSGQDPR